MGPRDEEVAFYDALATSKSAIEVFGDAQPRAIARDLVKSVRENVTIDWNLRESSKANIRLNIRNILRRHGYPPDKMESATEQVLEQAELFSYIAA